MSRSSKTWKPTPSPTVAAYQLKVELIGSDPSIWRRFRIAADATLADLHFVLQVVMGWTDSHLHSYEIGKVRYGVPEPGWWVRVKNERTALLSQALPKARGSFFYEYDFGDSWEHQVVVEKIERDVPRTDLPVCLEGERACPPEDCGGIGGFYRTLEIVADRRAPEHLEMKEWLGEYEPETFDLDAVNAGLRGL